MYKLLLFLEICLAFALGSKLPVPGKQCESSKIIGCYYIMNLAEDGTYEGLTIEKIDVSLCTHIFFYFVGIKANASVEIVDPYTDIEFDGLKNFNDLRKKNPKLKTLAVIAGMYDEATKDVNNKPFTDPTLREKLVNNVVDFVKKCGFNGIDIEYLRRTKGGAGASDKKNFVSLLKALRERFDKERLILSVAVDPNEMTAEILYDIKGISTYVNFINLIPPGFHDNSDAGKKYGVGHYAPMYPSLKENAEDRKKNIDYVVKYWIRQGAPPSKLILGTSFDGLPFTLANPKQVGRGAPFTKQGKYYAASGYDQICGLIKKWNHLYDEEQQVPYIYNGTEIIAYDDVHSIQIRAEYANKMHLGGAMVYTIDHDDFAGACGEKFPLLKTLNRVLIKKC